MPLPCYTVFSTYSGVDSLCIGRLARARGPEGSQVFARQEGHFLERVADAPVTGRTLLAHLASG